MDYVKFSVIIPTHDRNDLLACSIESVLGQTLKPFELLVVDDVSCAATEDLVNSFSKVNEVSVVYIENRKAQGAISSRNLAGSKASGDFLAFLDDDDYWNENYLLSVADEIIKNGADIVVSQYKCVEGSRSYIGKVIPKFYSEKALYVSNPGILCSNFVVSKSAFLSVKGYDAYVKGSADKDILIQLKRKNYKHAFINSPALVYWRTGHEGQWSSEAERVLPSVRRFYLKYFFDFGLMCQIKMIMKMAQLFFRSKIKF